ncbi:MAG: outer membrane protein transport protein [Cyclonatronaceae bacterium]
MKNIRTVFTASLLLLCLSTTSVFAGGYQLNLLGQRQIAMGHTGVGMPLDIATIAMNPGGLATIDHNELMFGSTATFINTHYRAPVPSSYVAKTDSPIRTPFSLYASYVTPVENLRAGIGVYTPYGNALRWEEGWKYRFLLREISLTTVFIQPTLSYRIGDRIGVGAGFVFAYGAVNLQRDLPVDALDGETPMVELDGTTTAVGFNAGIYGKVNDRISLGVSYRSQIDMEVSGGDADFTVPVSLSGSFPEGNRFDAALPLPAVLSIGLGLQATHDLKVNLDANLTFWSAYESLVFEFEQNTATVQDLNEARNFNDRWIFRVGGEYDAGERLQLRLGGYFDPSPVDEGYITPETPDLDRIGISGGFGFAITPQTTVNASVLLVLSSAREQTEQDAMEAGTFGSVPLGEFKTRAWLPGISISHRF